MLCVSKTIIHRSQEGRAALATSFQLFKFLALYSLLQFSCTLQMDLDGSYLSQYQFMVR